MNDLYNDKIYMRRSDTMKGVRRFKVPAKANQSTMMEAYSQTLWTWVGRNTGEWKGREWYNENECEMEVRKPGQKSQRWDVKAWNRLSRKWFVE